MAFLDNADSAGRALKKSMGLDERSVQVDGRGMEVQLPPEGSYARQAIEAKAEAAREAPGPEQPARPQTEEAHPVQADGETEGARARIEELARRRRDEEKRRLEAEQQLEQLKAELEKERSRRNTVESEYQKFLSSHVENLDPEVRDSVMRDARIRELLAEHEDRILKQVSAPIQEIREREFQRELQNLSNRYPGYDHESHAELVRDFMIRNPYTTPDQAFRAVASDEVLFVKPAVQEQSPAFIHPKGSRTIVEAERPKEDPNESLRDKTRKVHAMARDDDPDSRRAHDRALDGLIKDRLFGG